MMTLNLIYKQPKRNSAFSFIMLNVIILNVVGPSVIILNVMAPKKMKNELIIKIKMKEKICFLSKEEVHSLHLQSKITVKVGNFMLVRGATTFCMKTLSTMTFIVTTLGIMTFIKMTYNIAIKHSAHRINDSIKH